MTCRSQWGMKMRRIAYDADSEARTETEQVFGIGNPYHCLCLKVVDRYNPQETRRRTEQWM